jgi:hypothetical protein
VGSRVENSGGGLLSFFMASAWVAHGRKRIAIFIVLIHMEHIQLF